MINHYDGRHSNEFFNGEEPYEYDYYESFIAPSSNDIFSLLVDCSYDDSIMAALKKEAVNKLNSTYNAVILIYDFEYEDHDYINAKTVEFYRTVSYEKEL